VLRHGTAKQRSAARLHVSQALLMMLRILVTA
jgi:hypothetical protein